MKKTISLCLIFVILFALPVFADETTHEGKIDLDNGLTLDYDYTETVVENQPLLAPLMFNESPLLSTRGTNIKNKTIDGTFQIKTYSGDVIGKYHLYTSFSYTGTSVKIVNVNAWTEQFTAGGDIELYATERAIQISPTYALGDADFFVIQDGVGIVETVEIKVYCDHNGNIEIEQTY